MAEIHLDTWAAKNGIPKRTAQYWAEKRRIPAKKKTIHKEIIKTWLGYVIDEDAELPMSS